MAEGFTPAEDFYPEDLIDDEYEYDEQTKAENIEIQDWTQTKDDFAEPPEEETPFVDNLPGTSGTPMSLEKQEKIKSFYKYLAIKLIKTHNLNMELYLK